MHFTFQKDFQSEVTIPKTCATGISPLDKATQALREAEPLFPYSEST